MDLDETLQDSRRFLVFSLALMSLSKCARLLLDGGADPDAVLHVSRGIDLISQQLETAARRLETDAEAAHEIGALCRHLGIPRAGGPSDPPT
ncbi:MAG: hypothetical protein C4524_04240, partial [Candidatus Zixiibacteriota bacterium]